MSILTKIFVVLTTILAVLLVPLMVAYVNNTDHYKADLEATQQQLQAAVARAQLLEVEQQNAEKEDASREDLIQAATSSLQNQLNEKLSEINSLKANLVAKDDQLTRTSSDLSAAVTAKKQSQNIIDKLNSELLTRRNEAIEAQRDLLAISDQLQEKTADLESMNEQVRLLQEQLADLEAQLAEAKQKQLKGETPTVAVAATSVPVLETPVQGIITGVENVAEDTFVAINLGSNDDVAAGMNFIIHKNGEYVGSMVITKVDLNSSAGRVTLAKGEVSRNLQVMSADF